MSRVQVTVGAAFVATGFVGLLLENVLEKLVADLVGTDASPAIVLAVYFSGLALGGALFGRFGAGARRPLLWFCALEAFVGVWALLVLASFAQVRELSPPPSPLVSVGLAALWILPPTLAMGASFPAMIAAATRMPAVSPRSVITSLYACNLSGALLGTTLGAYAIFPHVGLGGALLLTIVVEVGVLIAASSLSSHVPAGAPISARFVAPGMRTRAVRDHALVLALAFASGFVFFAFEVLAVHLLGASGTAFANMLAGIIAGTLAASLVATRLGARGALAPRALTWALLAAAAAIATTSAAWTLVPHGAGGVRFFVATAVVMAPAFCLGLVYPLLFHVNSFDVDAREALTGYVAAANAIGCFTGALFTGFVLLPAYGTTACLIALACVLSLCALLPARTRAAPSGAVPSAAP